MSAKYSTIQLKLEDSGIAHLMIHRPKKLNALNNQVLNELDSAIASMEESAEVAALLITGSGEKAFVAGADIGELKELDGKSGRKASEKGQRIFERIEQFPVPTIAVIDGYALGGGAELAMAAHMRIASPNAVIGLPEVTLGLIPGYGGTQRLARLTGMAKAFEMVLSGEPVKAEDALRIGLVNRVAEHAENEARELLSKILKNGPLAVRKAIKAVHASGSANGFETEATLFGELCETKDFKEGTTAFLEKRKADFTGT